MLFRDLYSIVASRKWHVPRIPQIVDGMANINVTQRDRKCHAAPAGKLLIHELLNVIIGIVISTL